MSTSPVALNRIKRAGYIAVGLLILAVVIMSFVELAFIYFVGEVPAFGSVRATQEGLPPVDQRGAFLELNQEHSPKFAGNLVELLSTSEPGVVVESAAATVKSSELRRVTIQSAQLGEDRDYRLYRTGDPTSLDLQFERRTGGKVLYITAASGSWPPGNYIVDIPSEGMFGGRTYFQFAIDNGRK